MCVPKIFYLFRKYQSISLQQFIKLKSSYSLMNEKTLLQLALSFSFLGVIILFLFLQNSTLPSSMINQLSDDDLDKTKLLNGTITQIRTIKNTTFIKLSQTNEIDLILFDAPETNFKINNKIQVQGRVDEYKDNLQIIADKVEVIK